MQGMGKPEGKALEEGRLTAFLDLCPRIGRKEKDPTEEHFNGYNSLSQD